VLEGAGLIDVVIGPEDTCNMRAAARLPARRDAMARR